MLTDRKTLSKLQNIENNYAALRFEKVADVPMEVTETPDHLCGEPAGVKWRKAPPGSAWGRDWITAWFRGNLVLPPACAGKQVFLGANTGAPEAMLLVDGEHRGVFDGNHPVVMMAVKGAAGRKYHIALEAYAGHSHPGTSAYGRPIIVGKNCRTFAGVEVLLERQDVTAFVFDLRVLRQLSEKLDENSLRRDKIAAALAEVFAVIDAIPGETGEESWRPRLAEARKILKPLLAAKNGSTAPFIGIMGHSHLDTAWLWPLAETRRKCARTFSSMLNLMEQYREHKFLQPAPCHAEMTKNDYPAVFRRMQKMYRQGRWEPNGAMYVEPDANIPSGEAFVRQLLVGAKVTAELFDGYRGDTLWLPDVFGYSAALPQILQGCGVKYFCTTKLAWSDTTRLPYDTFHWKGIDGTSVLAHFNQIHCWPDPATLISSWNWVQHKDVQDRRLVAFGYGDGGGGPQAEMMEVARRVEDLEGCPRTSYTTLTDFMDGVARDLGKKLPTWSGELYLECHRGVQTSIARIKRGNRKSELALRDAEFLCTLAAIKGAKYPADELLEAWKLLLVNQFHDILPGSSIARVNDEAVATFSRICEKAGELAERGARALLGRSERPGASLLLVNSLSWDRDGEIVLPVPKGTAVAGEGVVSQAFKDIEGSNRLAVGGLTLPALGAKAVPLEKAAKTPRAASPFKVKPNLVETPHAIVRFGSDGRIVSFFDRTAGREIVRPGGALNTFLLGEDVPLSWDNWDIDRDTRAKLRPAGDLVSRKVVADGPLQLRIRSVYKLSKTSTVTQDAVFHSLTPRVDFETVVEWHEKHKLLKAAFELDVRNDFARHEIQFGHVQRPTHTNLPQDRARFEVAAHKWTDLGDNGFGVALLNDCKYGIGVEGGELRLSLLKSGTHPDERGDRGKHSMTYSLLPHGPFGVRSVVREAYELNVPVSAFNAGPKAKDVPSLLAVDAENVVVEAVKWAEDGRGFVARLYEAGGSACRATVKTGVPVRSASETNMLEEEPKKLRLARGAFTLSFRPFEIKTIRVEPKS